MPKLKSQLRFIASTPSYRLLEGCVVGVRTQNQIARLLSKAWGALNFTDNHCCNTAIGPAVIKANLHISGTPHPITKLIGLHHLMAVLSRHLQLVHGSTSSRTILMNNPMPSTIRDLRMVWPISVLRRKPKTMAIAIAGERSTISMSIVFWPRVVLRSASVKGY
jgi:hypothetical protein